MSDRIRTWFELPKAIECNEEKLMRRIEEVHPEYVALLENGNKELTGCEYFCYIEDFGLPGFVGIFIWTSDHFIFSRSDESTKCRKFIKDICEVFGAKEAWYTTELSMDAIEQYADPYDDIDYDWKSVVVKHSVELKRSYERAERGEYIWEPVVDGIEVIFHHDDFWDLDKEQ